MTASKPSPTRTPAPPVVNREKFYGRTRGRNVTHRDDHLLTHHLPQYNILGDGDDYSDISQTIELATLFDDDSKPLWLEIGFGGGEHLAHQAKINPHVNMIGCEPFVKGVAKILTLMDDNAITNIRLWPHDGRPLLDRLPEGSIDRMFLLFNDPWPKKRHHNRRFVPANLDRMARILKSGAELRMAHDHKEYFSWMLYHTLHHPAFQWQAECADDWRVRPPDWIETRYQQKALKQGRDSHYLSFIRV